MRHAFDASADNFCNIGPFVHPKRQHRRNHAVKLAFRGESPRHRIPDERRHGAKGLFHIGNGKQVAREKIQEKQQHQRRDITDGIDEKLNGQRRDAAFPGGKGAQNAADEQSQRHRPDAEAESDDEPPDQEAGLVAAGRAADKEIRQFRPAPAIGGYGFRTPQEKAGSQKQQDDQNGVHPPERGEKPPLPTVLGIGRPFAPERLPGAAGAHRSCASQSVVLNQK